MNLVIDIGNSTIKYAVFQDNACIMHLTADFDSCDELKSILSEYDIDYAIASCVATPPKHFQTTLEELPHPLLLLDSSTRLPIEIRYKTLQTLGADRIAAAVGAWADHKGNDLLIIDMGTCITYDILTRDNIYIGGNIAPGIEMRLKAMHEHTARLPEIHTPASWTAQIGGSTEEAMLAGTLWGIKYEMEGYISALQAKNPRMRIILTGGDSELLRKHLDTNILHDNMLVEKGLNTILEYNKKQ